ncbi:ABC-type branched-chain amino acid transport system, substrate-binding protein [Parafrankia irregularis]|uniref:ABC-type branched-chain amino acid transport system, substrate-binding protein n=1 Tax=Parafrankia irregularis TaxID=795642 RepID=A0A0S4QT90_9ACTN|nr:MULTISPECIES: ABC transporter substrate-binding protein [Parafrankia]MBE3202439.1 ABC transporter substrate-binding protein [Parafrankia sp. CH37]CUU58955.1 ABC-type branched-chain amino acid transport system, substrate-binding protein [Parafrankia irregularis]
MRRHLSWISSVVVIAGLLVGACSNSGDKKTPDTPVSREANASPGVTADEIHFAAIGTKTNNPLGTCLYDCFIQGINAYFDYRNSEGGLDGRKLKLTTTIDDALAKNKEGSLQIINDNDTFATLSVPMLATGWPDLANAGIPVYSVPWYPDDMNGHDSIYASNGVECIACTRHFMAYAPKVLGDKKIATLGYGVSQSSKDCANAATDTIKLYSKETGQQVVYTNNGIAFGIPNGIGPEVSAMKNAGVEFIVSCFDINGQKTLAQELKRQGMADVPILQSNSYDLTFMKNAGDLFEGDVLGVAFRPFESNGEGNGLALFKKWMEKSGSKLTELAEYGWIAAETAYQGIKAAGPGFTQASVVKATNALTSFTAGGLVPAIDWSRQHEMPTQDDPATHGPKQECMSLLTYKGGKFEFIGGATAEKPWLCWPGTDRKWSEPVPTDFQ